MRYTFTVLLICSFWMMAFLNSNAQTNTFPASGSAGIGTSTPNASSVLDIVSTTQGVLFPRMTLAQRNAITSPATGLFIDQTDNTKGLFYYSGTAWTLLSGAGKLLDNLTAPTAMNMALLPNANSTFDLGSSSKSWKDLYIDGSIYINDIKFADNDSFFANTFLGQEVGKLFQSSSCTGIGLRALYYNDGPGNSSVAIGDYSLYSNSAGNKNTGFGGGSLSNNSYGPENAAFGVNAGGVENNTLCTYFGINASAISGPTNNYLSSMALGDGSEVTANYQTRIGNLWISSIGGYANWTVISDGRYKQHIKENVPGLEFINQLKPVTYNLDINGIAGFLGTDKRADIKDVDGKYITLKEDEATKKLKQQGRDEKSKIAYTGFIAQDVEAAANRIGYDFSGVDKPKNEYSLYGLCYENFVVPSVKAVQELDEKNEQLTMDNAQLKMENSMLEVRVAKLESLISQNNFESADGKSKGGVVISNEALLGQNIHNPFDNSTIIPFRIPEGCKDASIMITNSSTLQVVMVIPVSCDETYLSIDAGMMTSGTFSYTLYAYAKMIDTKQMELRR